MVQVKPQEAERFVSRPDPALRVVLIHGSDTGLVAERAAAFARAVLAGSDDPFGMVRLDSSDVAADPGRLADEANTIALFGGARAIWVRVGGNRPIQAAVEAVLAKPPADAWIILEAGDLKKSAALRRLCEAAPGAAALACYADGDAALDRLIDAELAQTGLSIDHDARLLLRGLLGADRLSSRAEIAKLGLYAHGARTVSALDVRAIVGDAGAAAIDDVIDAAAVGDLEGFDRDFRRLLSAGTAAFAIASSAMRHFQLLHRLRGLVDQGTPPRAAVDNVGGLFFQRKAAVEQALKIWKLDRLQSALDRLASAVLDSRLNAAIGDEIIGQVLLSVASQARQARR